MVLAANPSNDVMGPPPNPASGDSDDAAAAMRGVTGGGTGKVDKDKTTRQSFSCAECRRLKLKCSRTWPCTSCEKRGCAQICPNGEMRTGKGKRLILANTEELHQRISLLEVALAQSHAENHDDPHPLLSSASVYLFASREPASSTRPYPRRSTIKTGEGNAIEEEDEVVESAFGTLTIGVEGEAKFVGSFAGSEYLREGDGVGQVRSPGTAGIERNGTTKAEHFSPDRDGVGAKFIGQTGVAEATLVTPPASATTNQWTTGNSRHQRQYSKTAYADGTLALQDSYIAGGSGMHDLNELRDKLPDWEEEGRTLVESYWENVNWMYQILPRPMFDNDHLMNAYDTESPPNAHKLACVFLVMAIGVMFDLNRQPFHKRGEELFLLGRACLSVTGLEHASPPTVQALHLMGTFMMNDNLGNGAEIFWPILGTAVKVAQSLGLHRDGSAFGLSMYEVEERRQVYWELVTYDRLQALCFGRPCATSNKAADTKFPEADEQLLADGDGYHHAKYRLIHMMERVIDMQTQTTPLTYASVTQLDSEIQEFKKTLPETLLPNVPINELPLDRMIHPHLVIHRLGIRLLVAQTRLLLNRPAFARALKDNPEDPSRSKFSASFVALYESAQEIVQLVKQLVIYHPSLVARWWFFWFHAFSSAVCLSAIAIRAPTCAFANPSFHGMSIVCDLSAAAREGCRAKNGLPILIRLRKRAQEALFIASRAPPKVKNKSMSGLKTESGEVESTEDDLSHLVSTAKLRRVGSSPPQKHAPLASGLVAGAVGITSPPNSTKDYKESTNTPSPHSATSTGTSITLADNSGFEGAVPPFPGTRRAVSGFGGSSQFFMGATTMPTPNTAGGGQRQGLSGASSPGLPTPAPMSIPWYGAGDSLASFLNADGSPSSLFIQSPQSSVGHLNASSTSPFEIRNQQSSNAVWNGMNTQSSPGRGGPLGYLQQQGFGADNVNQYPPSMGMGMDLMNSGMEGLNGNFDIGLGMGMDMDTSMAVGGDISSVLGNYEGENNGFDDDIALPNGNGSGSGGGGFDIEAFLNQMTGDS